MSSHLGLLHAYRLRIHIHCMFTVTFLCRCFLKAFSLQTVIAMNLFIVITPKSTLALSESMCSGSIYVTKRKSIVVNRDSTFPRSSELESHYHILFSVIPRTHFFAGWRSLTPLQDIQSEYSKSCPKCVGSA